MAQFVGWQRVEQSLDDYGLLSNSFFVNPIKDFQQMGVENSDGRRARSRNWAINFDRRVIAQFGSPRKSLQRSVRLWLHPRSLGMQLCGKEFRDPAVESLDNHRIRHHMRITGQG